MGEWLPLLDSVRSIEGVVSATPFALTKVVLVREQEVYGQAADLYGVDVESLDDAATGIEEENPVRLTPPGRDRVWASTHPGGLQVGGPDVPV